MTLIVNINDREYEEIKEDAETFRSKGLDAPYLYKVIESGVTLPSRIRTIRINNKRALFFYLDYD